MPPPFAQRAIADALQHKNAILKFISPNNVGITGSHECGYYLPKPVWRMYTSIAPTDGLNEEEAVEILWQNGRTTDSRIKWYGNRTRSEYRLTRFGRDFPFLTADNVGDLFILIRVADKRFRAYVLYDDDDTEEIEAALGVEVIGSWAVYTGEPEVPPRSEDECIDTRFRSFAEAVDEFPSTAEFSQISQEALTQCILDFGSQTADERLLRLVDEEYALFKMIERRLCQSEITRLFKSVDDFLSTAARMLNRRKSRAGRSLENHVGYLLKQTGIPFDVRPDIEGQPDIVIPGKDAYDDPSHPIDKIWIVGVKRTCKDRWRQVLNEARRIPQKHILTIQEGISERQLREMGDSNVTLVVPERLHSQYPSQDSVDIFTLEGFMSDIQGAIS